MFEYKTNSQNNNFFHNLNFNSQKLTINDLECVCGKKECTKMTCSFSTRKVSKKISFSDIVKKASQKDLIKPITMTEMDNDIINTNSFVGNIDSDFNTLLLILHNNLTPESNFYNVKSNLINYVKSKNSISKLGSLKSNTYHVDTSIRNSLSVNLNSQITQEIGELLKPTILENYKKCVPMSNQTEMIIHPSHSTLVLYEEGQFFNLHRDKILNCPATDESEWQMYSLIICIDSNLDKKANLNHHEGCTIVYLPPYNSLNYHNQYPVKDFKCVPHVFNQSIISGEFLGFPANAKHFSQKIDSIGKHKFILKMDLWIKTRNIIPRNIDFLIENDLDDLKNNYSETIKNKTIFSCNCKLCNPYRQINNVLVNEFLMKKGMCFDTVKTINSFLKGNEIVNINQNEYYSSSRFRIFNYFPKKFYKFYCNPKEYTNFLDKKYTTLFYAKDYDSDYNEDEYDYGDEEYDYSQDEYDDNEYNYDQYYDDDPYDQYDDRDDFCNGDGDDYY